MLIHLPRRTRTPAVNSLRIRLAGVVVVLGSLLMPPADAHPNASERQSQASVMASAEVPLAVLHALAQGGKFVITGVVVAGGVAAITVSGVGLGASFVVHLSVEAVKRLAIAAGKAVDAVAVSGGWLLMAADEALCFIADDATRAHIHSRALT
jgi:hypothetical protein